MSAFDSPKPNTSKLLTKSSDEKTRFTASDSLVSKYWTNSLGYISDPYIDVIFEKLTKHNTVGVNLGRRSPIIHRGYYARNESISKLLLSFLEATNESRRQIICLGSGFDSTSLLSYSKGYENVRTFEVDFPQVISRKADLYLSEPLITSLLLKGQSTATSSNHSNALATISEDDTLDSDDQIESSTTNGFIQHSTTVSQIGPISLIAQDLRNHEQIINDLLVAGFDVNAPTFILTECVLVYIDREHVLQLCSSIAALIQSSAMWVSYDMIHPHDMYGKTMSRNLRDSGFHIPGFAEFPNLEAQKQRFLETNWNICNSMNMLQFFDKNVFTPLSDYDRRKLAKIELFDEFEEWNIIMSHYSLTVAVKYITSSVATVDTEIVATTEAIKNGMEVIDDVKTIITLSIEDAAVHTDIQNVVNSSIPPSTSSDSSGRDEEFKHILDRFFS